MRYVILLASLCIFCRVMVADQYVYVRDGAVVSEPRALPSVGVRQDGAGTVLGLHGADAETQALCGWYRVVDAEPVPSGHRVVSRVWTIEGTAARQEVQTEPIPPQPAEYSKARIVEGLDAVGMLDPFMAWISADPAMLFRWNAATTLEATNMLMVAAVAMLPDALGVSSALVEEILEGARVR
jgi:hypothetical protein